MENTNKMEMREILSVYEHGDTRGANRGFRTGMLFGSLVTLLLAGLVFAGLFGAGMIMVTQRPVADSTTNAPPHVGTGPIGVPTGPIGMPAGGPPAPLVPRLPPAPAPDTQTIAPAPTSGLPRAVRLPSD